jgi:hypothetical protein
MNFLYEPDHPPASPGGQLQPRPAPVGRDVERSRLPQPRPQWYCQMPPDTRSAGAGRISQQPAPGYGSKRSAGGRGVHDWISRLDLQPPGQNQRRMAGDVPLVGGVIVTVDNQGAFCYNITITVVFYSDIVTQAL